jgi:DNA-binding transcriptional ArsR family regulator
MEPEKQEQILSFFKALADVERLKITGLLALEPRSAAQVAELLQIKLQKAVNHLAMLVHFGLVKQVGSSYSLDAEAVQAMARQALTGSRPSVKLDDLEGPEYDRKVLSNYLNPDGSLKALPTQEKKLMVVLRYILPVFQVGERYPEKTVNQILSRYYADTASLRRYLVDAGMLTRENGVYWRV